MPGSGTAVPPVEPPDVVEPPEVVVLPPLVDDEVVDELVLVDDEVELPVWQFFLHGFWKELQLKLDHQSVAIAGDDAAKAAAQTAITTVFRNIFITPLRMTFPG